MLKLLKTKLVTILLTTSISATAVAGGVIIYRNYVAKDKEVQEDEEIREVIHEDLETPEEVVEIGEHVHEIVLVSGKAATCLENGLTDGQKCSVCNKMIVEQAVIPSLGHLYVDGVCVRCGAKENVACTHEHTQILEAVEPTCTKTGLTEGKRCSDCGALIVPQQVVETIEHEYVKGVCQKCGDIIDDWCNHSQTSEVAGYDATCLQDGLTSAIVCDECLKVIQDHTIIPALGHKYFDGICIRCGAKEIKNCAHAHTYNINEVLPTCTSKGKTSGVRCLDCGALITVPQEVDALGHTYVDHICTRCGDKEEVQEESGNNNPGTTVVTTTTDDLETKAIDLK